jgi:hypothetical protein
MAVYLHNVQPSESSIDQIGFECVAFLKIIFPLWTLKSVKCPYMMEYDQRVIIRFLSNEGITANEITIKLQVQFAEHAYKLRTVRFWIAEVRCGSIRFDSVIKTSMTKFALEGLLSMMSMPKFWQF